jgi:hypothetical protein
VEPDATRVIVAPLKSNQPAVFVSNPLKYGPGGASADADRTAAKVKITIDAAIIVLWNLIFESPEFGR